MPISVISNMEAKANIKVGDKVKLKSLDYIKGKFSVCYDQEYNIIKKQGEIFKVVEIPDGRKSVVVDRPIFDDDGSYVHDEIHIDAVYLYRKATNISLPENLFEI